MPFTPDKHTFIGRITGKEVIKYGLAVSPFIGEKISVGLNHF